MMERIQDYIGKKVLITAGPTIERIDPVRFLSNFSTGKMGYSIAKAAVERGGEVILITGPTNIKAPENCKVICIESALEMFREVLNYFEEVDVIIKTAAVADYRPLVQEKEKIKKNEDEYLLKLVRNPDIAKYIGQHKKNQIFVGFAAETKNELDYGKNKLKNKNFDMICINNVKQKDAGFGSDTNIMTLLKESGESTFIPKATKYEIAHKILDEIKNVK